MIDTPQNCFDRARISRIEAEGPMLENARNKHLASAAAWESLGLLLQSGVRKRQAPPARPQRLYARPPVEGWENEGGSLRHRP